VITSLTHITVTVRDQDEALSFYTEKLGFVRRADEAFGEGARWLTVSPPGSGEVEIILHLPSLAAGSPNQEAVNRLLRRVGQAAIVCLATDDCQATYEELSGRGVEFISPPQAVPWGRQAIFQDLYGNPYLIVEAPSAPGGTTS